MCKYPESKIILDRNCFEESRGNIGRCMIAGGSMAALILLITVVFFIVVGL